MKIFQLRKNLLRNLVTFLLLISLGSGIFLFFGQSTKRVFETRGAFAFRAQQTYSFLNLKKNLLSSEPIFYGPGLGVTYNRQTYYTRSQLEQYEKCSGFKKEYEFTRILCAFGKYGYLLIFFTRLLPSIISLNFALKIYRSTKNVAISSIYIWSSTLLLYGAQLKTNDVLISLLIPMILAQYLLSDFLRNTINKYKV